MDWTTCEDCGRLLYEKDGPVCDDCQHVRRSEAAKQGAQTRQQNASSGAESPGDERKAETTTEEA